MKDVETGAGGRRGRGKGNTVSLSITQAESWWGLWGPVTLSPHVFVLWKERRDGASSCWWKIPGTQCKTRKEETARC